MSYREYQWEVPVRWKVAFFVVSLVFLLDLAQMADWIRSAGLLVLAPWQKEMAKVVAIVDRQVRMVAQLRSLASKNLDLERQLAEMRVLADQASQLKEENSRLKNDLGLLSSSGFGLRGATILALVDGGYRVYLADKAEVGSAVLAGGRVLGVIGEVRNRMAKVEEVGSSGAKLKVRILPGAKIYEIAKKGNQLEVEKVPQDEAVQLQALVVTAGDNGLVPPDLPIGRVSEVFASKEAIFATIKIAPNIASVGDVVYVIAEEKEE